ncbi:MAG TPA: DUF2279 domain-containing protein [Ohtaekwangia sp.]
MARIKLLLLLLLIVQVSLAQTDTLQPVNKKRLRNFIIGGSVGYAATLVALNELWYSDAQKQAFHFFNDNGEWNQIDKIGHFYSAFYFSYGFSKALQGCNVPVKKSDLIGAITGFAVLVPIEVFDGYSDAYGASGGDLLADAAGSVFYLGQKRLWNEIRIHPKFSFHRTEYPDNRPDVLGDDLPSELIKDYNGQTFWLSVDMDKFMQFPKWLNLGIGYGAEGMVYARDYQNTEAGFPPAYRQYYFTLDFDLTAIKSRSKLVNTLLFIGNMIKLPSPTLEFSSKGTRFYPFYF